MPTDRDPAAAEPANTLANQSGGAAATTAPFLKRCHAIWRVRHDALRTEECYVPWIKKFMLFHNQRHPQDMGAPEMEAFLTQLAVERNVAASTQNQAFPAWLFL